jgi:hypothetical protein
MVLGFSLTRPKSRRGEKVKNKTDHPNNKPALDETTTTAVVMTARRS